MKVFKQVYRQFIWNAVSTVSLLILVTGGPARAYGKSLESQISVDSKGPANRAIPLSIDVNGVTRTYLVYVPRKYEPGESALIIALHGRGGGGPGLLMEQYSKLDDKADRAGFAVAYLDGLPDAVGTLNWNYYYDPFFVDGPDDVSFVREVIDSLQSTLHPDRRRIYVTGTSAGGFMAQRIGVELSDRVAAIGVVEGGISVLTPTSPSTVPAAKGPISVLLLKGDQDPNNLYCGAVFPQFGIVEASADQDLEYWSGASANRCSRLSSSLPLCLSIGVQNPPGPGTMGTPSTLKSKRASDCRKDTEVLLYRLLGGLDIWNQGAMNIPSQIPYNPDLNERTGTNTNDILWKFFEAHPKKDSHPDN